ncbi:MAG TPA: hypothetical protein VGH89_05605, partial [Pseudonocardia sp.]
MEGPEASGEIATRHDNAETNGKVDTAAVLTQAVEPPAPVPPKRSKRKLFIVLAIIVGLIVVVGGGLYWHHASQFVSTDNAQVDGDQIQINAPTTGTVSGWVITQGSTVTRNQVVGRIRVLGTGPQQ